MSSPDRPSSVISSSSVLAPGAAPGTASARARAVVDKARALGFEQVGIARADVPLTVEHERYAAFVADGKHGDMGYLARDVQARRTLDGESVLPGARSVISVARPYARTAEAEASDPPVARLIARYARGHDYHNHLRKKLRLLAKFVRTLEEGARARPLCDVEPVLERAWAARAGVGFVGKNGLVIVPGQGSYVLLGEVVTTVELEQGTPMTERCGSCTRCLDACPTAAFEAPFVLDPRRCISYLTIEAEGAPPLELREAIGEHLFGCDDCQSVCPFNRTRPPPPEKTRAYEPLEVWRSVDLEALLVLDDTAFAQLTEGSPLKRATRHGLARNALLVLANRAIADTTDGALAPLVRATESSDPLLSAFAREELERVATARSERTGS